jgi:selenocysteine lyase/cysteine desulfurase
VVSSHSILDAIEQAMTPRTRLVMVGHIVLFGQINPARAIADLVHRRGAKLLVDGVLAIGHIPTDVKAMNCDFYAAGFHKFACGSTRDSGVLCATWTNRTASSFVRSLFGRRTRHRPTEMEFERHDEVQVLESIVFRLGSSTSLPVG